MGMTRTMVGCATLALLASVLACGGEDSSAEPIGQDGGKDGATQVDPGEDQTPPQGAANVEAWLKGGAYKDWQCEPTVHESRDPSPHGFNRICSNDVLAANAKAKGGWPRGSAGVKELYASMDGTKPIGYAVYLKTEDDSAGGANWYWYERIPKDGDAPEGESRVVADGLGDSGPAKGICVSCHLAAGADAAHTPTEGARDQVYTPVP